MTTDNIETEAININNVNKRIAINIVVKFSSMVSSTGKPATLVGNLGLCHIHAWEIQVVH